jgi:hypothetical protein
MALFDLLMRQEVSLLINLAAILVILYGLFLSVSLRPAVAPGAVSRWWTTLTLLIVLFTIGFLASPYLWELPPANQQLVVALVFLFGAFYVVLTIRMLHGVIRELRPE